MSRSAVGIASKVISRTVATSLAARFGRYRSWPDDALLLSEPLAMAEERTSRLRRIYANCLRDAWDGPTLFREAMARHGGIQLAPEQRVHLSYPISMLMWGELAAWIVSAELAERLEDPDARMAASSQVFDEARHFYTLRDYLAALHVPVPKLDTYFAIAARRLLMSRDLDLKLFAMQILAEGTAQTIFRFLADAKIEPVLTDLLPFIERDEARHVGLGVLHLPERLAKRSPRECRRLANHVAAIGDLFGATQIRYVAHYRALGAEPRDLFRAADKMLHELSNKLGTIPGTDEPYFRTANPADPNYERNLALVFPPDGKRPGRAARFIHAVVDFGARALPA
jgi:hypothetical protein